MDIPVKYKQLWRDWDVRVLILLSLSIQIALIFLGRRRRTSTSRWIRVVVWCSYLLADWVADFVLGQLSNAMDDSSSSNAIIAFWAPFLILHLGGPDTITAYSMEDNELWGRHLLGLGYELAVAFYVLFRALPNTLLLTPTLLIFLVAIIKYLERSYSLYKASAEGFDNFIDSFPVIPKTKDLNILSQSLWFYTVIKPSFFDIIPFLYRHEEARLLIQHLTTEEALRVTSQELSYAYDEFYTKAVVNHSKVGYFVRILCTACILLSFFLFILAPKNDFQNVDIAITYVLLAASVCLDFVAIFMLVFSNWMVVFLLSIKKVRSWSMWLVERIVKFNIAFHERRCWSMKISQLNIVDNVLINFEPKIAPGVRIMNWVVKRLSFTQEITWTTREETYTLQVMQPVEATPELLEIIISCMQRRSHLEPKDLNKPAGFSALQQVTTISDWAVPKLVLLFEGMPLDQQVLVWHITTELCLHWNLESHHQMEMETKKSNLLGVNRKSSEMEVCKCMSNYMMHAVLVRPKMMPTIGASSLVVFRKVFEDMVQFIRTMSDGDQLLPPNRNFKEAFMMMMMDEIDWRNDEEYLLVAAQVLARLMLVIGEEERWGVMATTWVELLVIWAKNSRGSMHLKQLSMGEELLSFVWLFSKHVEIDDVIAQLVDVSADRVEKARDLLADIQFHL